MNRRKFIQNSLLASLGLSVSNHIFGFEKDKQTLSYKELIGKGQPQLFGDHYKLREDAHLEFQKMSAAAETAGIKLQIVSSYRDFNHQNRIWERKFKSYTNQGLSEVSAIKKIIEYSTIPGTSRHHWGTDMDVIDASVTAPNSVLQTEHFEEGGCFRAMKLWMEENSERFGFYLVYTNQPKRKGFKYEPWHYSYKPLSFEYLQAYKKMNIENIIHSEKLMGHESFTNDFISQYLNENVLDINPELL